jgi:adenosylcobyric acid synthase
MPALMVQGVSSWAGKSLLTTALVRFFARRGVRVAPFKGQNMSNNARVVAGGEIGVAQYLQALAAGVEPDVRMNPVLVKPEGDRQSQVVVEGRPDPALSAMSWRGRGPLLWPPIERALRSLLAEYELVVIEGAGSPAEINLRDTDLTNMRVALAAAAPVVLVADIDRGGAFAHLFGTWSLLPNAERSAIRAFVLNKFRGDASLLPPAPAELERLTGVPLIGVLPWLEHGLPDEDGAAPRGAVPGAAPRNGFGATVAVVRYPTASNLDEFRRLEQVVRVHWATRPDEIADAELVVMPGSKHVSADLAWLRRSGLADAVAARARAGRRVVGICGGLQMLGEALYDEAGVDGSAVGLGLLPLTTRFGRDKLTRRTTIRFGNLSEPWDALRGVEYAGYEIRHGRFEPDIDVVAGGPVLGLAAHGAFESGRVLEAIFGRAPQQSLDTVFDELADSIEAYLDTEQLLELAEVV